MMHRSTVFRRLFVWESKLGGRPSGTSSPQAVFDLVGGLRKDGTDAAAAQVSADRAGGVGAICEDGVGAGSRPAEAGSWDPNPGHGVCELSGTPQFSIL